MRLPLISVTLGFRLLSLPCRQPEEVIEAGDKQAEVAPEVQDDFDIPEGDLVEIQLQDQEEVKVGGHDLECRHS